MDQIPHGQGGRDKLGPLLAKLIISNFQFLKVRDIALVRELYRSTVRDFVDIQFQVPDVVQSLWLDERFESLVWNPIDSQINDLQIWELRVVRDVICSLRIDVIRAQVYLFDVSQVGRGK